MTWIATYTTEQNVTKRKSNRMQMQQNANAMKRQPNKIQETLVLSKIPEYLITFRVYKGQFLKLINLNHIVLLLLKSMRFQTGNCSWTNVNVLYYVVVFLSGMHH